MRREVGTSAGVLALLALVLHTQLPNPDGGASGSRTGTTEAAAKKNAQTEERDEPVDGPWLATQAFFNAASSPLKPPRSTPDAHRNDFQKFLGQLVSPDKPPTRSAILQRLGSPDPTKEKTTERFSIVATVADPLHTHMALRLDEETEAIERAVQENYWDFSEQWLPWLDRFDGMESSINSRRSERWRQREQEELPGILIFRAKSDRKTFPKRILFVFLVPETVTGGVNGPAFYAAMHLAGVLSPKHPTGILGPSFSGSFASLATLIETMRLNKTNTWGTVYGTASNLTNARSFSGDTRFAFHDGNLNQEIYQEALFCNILKEYGVGNARAAVLKEDEGGLTRAFLGEPISVYIGSKLTQCGQTPDTYIFPREISHLRNAYQDTSRDDAKDPYGDQPGKVGFSIRDPNSGEDSIPTFSETQTPLSQDTILGQITHELNRRHTHVVFISVTNPLDGLFLLQALRAACPDTRAVVENPNVLYVAAASHQDLTGTVFLSAYPMFFEGDDWLQCPSNGREAATCRSQDRMLFPDSPIQALYNVTQLLLSDLTHVPPMALRGYGQPGLPYPGVWVLTLNRFGFLPVNLFPSSASPINFTDLKGHEVKDTWFRNNPGNQKPPALPDQLDPVTAPRPWMLTVFVTSLITLLACCVFFLCNKSPRDTGTIWLVLRDGFEPAYPARFEAVLVACLSLSAIAWFLGLPWVMHWAVFSPSESSRIRVLAFFVVLGFAVPLLTLLSATYWLKEHLKITKTNPRGIAYFITPVALFVTGIWVWFSLCRSPTAGLFFSFRCLEIYSGSSPSVPFAIIGLIFFCLSWFHLRQYTLAGWSRPRLIVNPGSAFRAKFRDVYIEIEKRISAPWTLPNNLWTFRAGAAVAFVLSCFLILGRSSTNAFELPSYNSILLAAVIAILLCLATKWYDLFKLWTSARSLLKLIQILPLHPALDRITRDWPKRSIWAFRHAVSKEAVEREMLYRLHRRRVLLQSMEVETPSATSVAAESFQGSGGFPEKVDDTAAEAQEDLDTLRALVFGANPDSDAHKQRIHPAPEVDPNAPPILGKLDARQRYCAEVTDRIYRHVLEPAWRASLIEDPEKRVEADKTPAPEPPKALPVRHLEACEDFVTLQFCRYISHAVAHVKRQATALSLSFMLLALLFNSYSPEASQLIARFLAGLFLIIGVVVWRVYSQMERDPVLSAIAQTTPGELSAEFWFQVVALGGLPLLGVIGHLFPSFSHFLFQWIAPSVQAAR
jgi:hypothetical protein